MQYAFGVIIVSMMLLLQLGSSFPWYKTREAAQDGSMYLQDTTDRGQLNIIQLTRQSLEGEFYNDRTGIYFKSAVGEGRGKGATSANQLTITTHGGRDVFSSQLLDEGIALVSVMGRQYLFIGGGPSSTKPSGENKKSVEYRMPESWSNLVEKALKSGLPLKFLTESKYLDSRGVQKALARDLRVLVSSEEGRLIPQTALELGRRGLLGSHSTGSMPLYVLAMRLAQLTAPEGCASAKNLSKAKGKKPSSRGAGEECGGRGCEGVCGVRECGHCCCTEGQVSFSCFNLFSLRIM